MQLPAQSNIRTAQDRYRSRIQAQLDRAAQVARKARDEAERAQLEAKTLRAAALSTQVNDPKEREGMFARAQAASDLARRKQEGADDAERIVHALSDQLQRKGER